MHKKAREVSSLQAEEYLVFLSSDEILLTIKLKSH